MLHYISVSRYDVELLSDALFNAALFNVSLFYLALFNDYTVTIYYFII